MNSSVAGLSVETPGLDLCELAMICFPALGRYALHDLVQALELEGKNEREHLQSLWRVLTTRARLLPLPLLEEITKLLSMDPLNPHYTFFHRALQQAARGGPEQTLGDLFTTERLPAPRKERPDDAERVTIDGGQVADALGPTGEFCGAIDGYESRPEQVGMAKQVAGALNEARHLFVEAGTGIGKSLAYLLPAVLWAEANDEPVVVSTNTKNLQMQLIEKDLPLIRRALGRDFKAAVIKGRANYLCHRTLLYVLQQADCELDPRDCLRMAGVVAWSVVTKTGDLAECPAWQQDHPRGMQTRLSSLAEECLGSSCPQRRVCFLRRARAKALAADIVVANHSLVFAEMGIKSPALPPYRAIIFDEAHNLEEAATSHFSTEVSEARIRFVLRRLWRGSGRKGAGILRSVIQHLESGGATDRSELREEAVKKARRLTRTISASTAEASPFFHALAAFLGKSGDSRRFGREGKDKAFDPEVEATLTELISHLSNVADECRKLAEWLGEMDSGSLPFNLSFTRELQAAALWMDEFTQDARFVVNAADAGFVYWVEKMRSRRDGARAWAAPLALGDRLAKDLYAEKDSIVFSSATLSVNQSFAFLKKRLGVDLLPPDRLVEHRAGTPFDYEEQCRVLVPMFLPEPDRGDTYAQELGDFLADLFKVTRGRAMALFTSYGMLSETARVLENGLQGEPIQILSQGGSGSRESITEAFRKDHQSVLMGTHSFWEGVDLVGETLSCLVITRLPFSVFTEPIIEARAEKIEEAGGNSFTEYSLPGAVIRFRQGFGRLIRHRTDRGIVIVADKRILSRRYGGWFRNSLPARTIPVEDRAQCLQGIEEFLGQGGW